ncbi:MAG: hypothetical protein AB1657_04170 [Candidatus Micrarchaeota archaeon]
MGEKKRIRSWFMKNIILPNNEIIDKPGYIVYRFGSKKKNCYLREVLMPESMLAGIETAFAEKYGKEGRKAVYVAGKMWGYRFAATSALPKRGSMPDEALLEVIEAIMRLLESEYSSKVEYRVDLAKSELEFAAKDLLVCKESGLGDFLTGTLNGTWEYMMGVQTEGVKLACQKRGEKCVILCAPPESHKKGIAHVVKVPPGLGLEAEYFLMNQPKRAHYAKNSLRDLLENRVIAYEGGFFRYGKSRLVLNEASSVYFLETVLEKLKGGERLLFEVAFKHCRRCVPGGASSENFLTDILPPFGWGDIHFDGSKAVCFGYPWTRYHRETTFPLMRGMVSGILSAGPRDVELKNSEPVISRGSLDLMLRS